MTRAPRIPFLALCASALTLAGCSTAPSGASQASAQTPGQSTPVREAGQESRLNVLFITADDFRPLIHAYGADVRTPNLDRLASQGLRFDNAYAQWPLCGTSRASFLTGLRPNTIGQRANWEKFRCTAPDIQTLPQYFKNAGYAAVRVGKAYHQGVPNDIGTAGPDDPASWSETINPAGHDHLPGTERTIINMTPGEGLGRAMAYLPDDTKDEAQTDGMVANAAIDKIKQHSGSPFFIFAGFYRPHVPEVAPRKYFDMYQAERQPLAKETMQSLEATLPASRSADTFNLGMSTEQQKRMIAAYKAATSFMDAQVGRILEELDRSGHAEDTIVVFTSDHGFLLGEHGQWAKNLLWQEATRVPLIIRAPGMKAGVSKKLVELVDLYPTLTELAGLPHYARNEGYSLTSLLRNPSSSEWNRPALSQVYGGRSVRFENWRYSEWTAGEAGRELYDLSRDPLEHKNLADDPAYADLARKLSAMLPAGAEEQPAYTYQKSQSLTPGRGGPPYPMLRNPDNCSAWGIG